MSLWVAGWYFAEPVIRLAEDRFTIREPVFKDETSVLHVPVLREGDLTETVVVTVNTKDASADAGKDYVGFFKGRCFSSAFLFSVTYSL